jgi:hypothetical protein
MLFSTCSASDVAGWTSPLFVVAPAIVKSTPIPNCMATSVSFACGNRLASLTNVVLQDFAKAVCSGRLSYPKPALSIVRCPTTTDAGRGCAESGVARPCSSTAAR